MTQPLNAAYQFTTKNAWRIKKGQILVAGSSYNSYGFIRIGKEVFQATTFSGDNYLFGKIKFAKNAATIPQYMV